jgi:predicted dithiol-disulfide oxidoreductase (DUF899 family)
MTSHKTSRKVVTREEWLIARKEHLVQEKEFTRLRDELSKARRELPWVELEKDYAFDGANGKEHLSDLFDGRHQLLIYHFMYGPDWEEGCPSCSFWADNYDRSVIHLNHRDISMVAVSKAPWKTLDAYRRRMGWSFKWFSSLDNDFNRDYHVSFTPEEMEKGEMFYNYQTTHFPSSEAPGLSVFYRDDDGSVYHTYSCYSRGLDMLNAAYHHMDLVPKGRDESDLPHRMSWLHRHDQY